MRRALARAALGLAVLAPSGLPQGPAMAQTSAPERAVKAAFLYKFLGFIEWPADAFPAPEAPVMIGVVGDDELARDLARLVRGRTSGGRAVEVRRVRGMDAVERVHVLFLASSESWRLRSWTRAVRERPVLVVSESPGALEHGSMINFVLSEGRVRFEIALAAAARSHLVLSSRLLAVAQSVTEGTP